MNITTSSWRYDNSGVDQGAPWRATGFNDATWSSGFGMFGFETTPQEYPYPFQTTIPAPDQANGHNTVYYRAHFQWDGSLTDFSLISTNYVDDGAVYYLNGVEVSRLRIAAGTVVYATLAANQPTEGQTEVLTFSTNNLVIGDNVMAVEVHQSSTTSSDDVFGMSLAAVHFTTNIVTQTFGVPLVLNEIMARNQTLTNYAGHTADYIEIYNPSTNAVDLSDLSLSNDPNQPRKFVFPANTSIAASGYFVVYCDDTSPVSSTNTGFGLGAKGDSVFFFHRPSAGGALLDGVSFGLQAADYSIGRSPDGVGNWALTTPTPGLPNNAAGLGGVASLKVNEWMADPSNGSDWFE
ncbi:MAG: lamin tail domain-containing protein, partial [Thermoanaerobaculia bacterium]